jgi:hypothetical protein
LLGLLAVLNTDRHDVERVLPAGLIGGVLSVTMLVACEVAVEYWMALTWSPQVRHLYCHPCLLVLTLASSPLVGGRPLRPNRAHS